MKKPALVFVFLIATITMHSQVLVTKGCKQAYRDILSLRFKEANRQLASEKNAKPDNIYITYLENYIDFLTLFIGENEDSLHLLENNKSNRIEQITMLSDTSPYKKYMLGNINLQWAVARLKFGEYFTAAFEINRAYRLLEANHRDFPGFTPNGISLGVLHIMIGLVPDKYQWILNLISMKGNIEQGKKELTDVLQKSSNDSTWSYLRDETLFYLGFIELNTNPDKNQSLTLLRLLDKEKDDNLLLSYLVINILIQNGRNDEALSEFARISNREAYFPFYYLDYLHGKCLLNKLETNSAAEKYTYFIENFSGKNYLKDALRRKAWTYLLNGDTLNYFQTLKQIPFVGNDDVDSDKQASFEVEQLSIPNIQLLKARLLFDGGYYIKADSVLNKINPKELNAEQNLERYYRKARIAHESGHLERAKVEYLQTIEKGKNLPYYYSGNAALKLAGIYEAERDYAKAEQYYRACLKMHFIEYETSIHTKAKTGLKRLSGNQ